MTVDVDGHRLFVAALDNDTVEVLDLPTGKRNKQLAGLKKPTGVASLADLKRLFVTNCDGSSTTAYDGKTLETVTTVELATDPDTVR